MGSTAATPAATTPGRTDPPVNDPALKRLFGHPEVAEILIRGILPEDADRIDFSTLEKLGTELVGEALSRRYADLMWTARTRDGAAQLLILIEFQGRQDRLMPLRTTIYALMAVQELLRRTRPPPHLDTIEVLQPTVLLDAVGPWRGPTALDELFPRGIPRDFRAIFRDPERCGSTPGIDLAETMNRLDRDNSMKATLAELRRLVRVAEETGDRMDRLLAECIGEWLVLKERITKEQKREAKTMAQVMTEYERSLEAFGSRRERKGRVEGRVELLISMASMKFGTEAGERLADLLGTPPDSGRLATAAAAVIECATDGELLRRMGDGSLEDA